MDFLHFVITQFNLRNFQVSDTDRYERWLRWTRDRIKLFRDYCLPSVLNQSNKDFTWLIFFDTKTPGEFSAFIGELESIPIVQICYSDGSEGFDTGYVKEISKRITNPDKWIMTTRFDNDDSLHKEAIAVLRDNFVPKHKYLISLASGYVLNISDKTVSHYFYPMSPFITLIENAEIEIRGVFEKIHTKWDQLRLFVFKEIWLETVNRKSRMSRFILKEPMWIQTVHGENISNSFFRGLPVLKEIDLSKFSLPITTERLPFKIITRYYNYVIWKRYLKCLIIKTLLKK
jgi:hypothetical protein